MKKFKELSVAKGGGILPGKIAITGTKSIGETRIFFLETDSVDEVNRMFRDALIASGWCED